MIFQFAVKHLRCLACLPLAAHVFDALLLTWTALSAPKRLQAIDRLEFLAMNMTGVECTRHRFGGIGFESKGVEFAHLHGNGLLDIHLRRDLADEAVKQNQAMAHHVFGPSAWVSYWLRSPDDIPEAMELLKKARALVGITSPVPGS